MKKLAIAAAAIAILAAASTGDVLPRGCDEFGCNDNGPQLTGIALPNVKARQPVVNALTLPSGQTVNLR